MYLWIGKYASIFHLRILYQLFKEFPIYDAFINVLITKEVGNNQGSDDVIYKFP